MGTMCVCVYTLAYEVVLGPGGFNGNFLSLQLFGIRATQARSVAWVVLDAFPLADCFPP